MLKISDSLLSVHYYSENNFLKLAEFTYGNISTTNQVIYMGNFSSASPSCSSFFPCASVKCNALQLHVRDPSVSLDVFE